MERTRMTTSVQDRTNTGVSKSDLGRVLNQKVDANVCESAAMTSRGSRDYTGLSCIISKSIKWNQENTSASLSVTAHDNDNGSQDGILSATPMFSLESSLSYWALREVIGHYTRAGADAEAIDAVIQLLTLDNSTSMTLYMALFCLTTLWVLACRSKQNKWKIIFGNRCE